MKIGDVSGSEGFWAAGKQFFRRNPGGFQGKIAPSRGQKTRRLGMLTLCAATDSLKLVNCCSLSLNGGGSTGSSTTVSCGSGSSGDWYSAMERISLAAS